jgi:hypothetical protein
MSFLSIPHGSYKAAVVRGLCVAGLACALLGCGSSADGGGPGFGSASSGGSTSSGSGSSSGSGPSSSGASGSSGSGGAADAGADGTTGGSSGGSSSGAVDGGSTGIDAGPVGDGGCGQLADGGYVWPNACSHTNSDLWISQHHDQIVQMNPVALLLNFANTGTVNGKQTTFDVPTITGLANQHIAAWQWATRYHGYKDPNAPPFINYSVKIIDLRDSSGQPNSATLPTQGGATNGPIDFVQLNSAAFATLIGIDDPASPGTKLNLCGLFEKGIIHEVWGMVGDTATNGINAGKFPESAENKVGYDANNVPLSPQKIFAVGNGPDISKDLPCKVSVRIYDFNPTRGSGCHLHAGGHGWENYINRGALPAFSKVGATFFNYDFNTRFNTDANHKSFYSYCPYTNAVCINWQSNIHASSGVSSSQAFDFADMSAGCGNVHFPPNATTQYTTAGDVSVLTSCENYGLHNGAGGKDLTTPYQDKIAAADYQGKAGVASDCGGTQPTYIFASMPGLGNSATASDGTPMKNWWVYDFY